jgi:hypothetical protein
MRQPKLEGDAMAKSEYREIEVVEIVDQDSYYMSGNARSSSVPNQWMLDVNSRYQGTIQLVFSLATALFGAAPLLFEAVRKDASAEAPRTLLSCMDWVATFGFIALMVSVCASLAYFYFSAKWVSKAWGRQTTVMWRPMSGKCVEVCLDWFFWISLLALVIGGSLEFWFFFNFKICSGWS